jgi:hypothetical protein
MVCFGGALTEVPATEITAQVHLTSEQTTAVQKALKNAERWSFPHPASFMEDHSQNVVLWRGAPPRQVCPAGTNV